jgi:hypothetical protein
MAQSSALVQPFGLCNDRGRSSKILGFPVPRTLLASYIIALIVFAVLIPGGLLYQVFTGNAPSLTLILGRPIKKVIPSKRH